VYIYLAQGGVFDFDRGVGAQECGELLRRHHVLERRRRDEGAVEEAGDARRGEQGKGGGVDGLDLPGRRKGDVGV